MRLAHNLSLSLVSLFPSRLSGQNVREHARAHNMYARGVPLVGRANQFHHAFHESLIHDLHHAQASSRRSRKLRKASRRAHQMHHRVASGHGPELIFEGPGGPVYTVGASFW
eukprot:TRINITY_DN178_c0_g1_i2.p3 TRINITY_DN178_c0_g1~~TRINITY_DN178_c0_g1_i2.p3  ORF type:complete len:112 (-),score=17.58 TRINITY_DN178_c0_g1_i2:150-485(-)